MNSRDMAPKPAQTTEKRSIVPKTAKVAFALCLPLLSIGAIGCAHSQAKAEQRDAERIFLTVKGYGSEVRGTTPPRERGESIAAYNARLVKEIVERESSDGYTLYYYGDGVAPAGYDLDTRAGRLKALNTLMLEGTDISQAILPLAKMAVYSEPETSSQAKEILFALAKKGVDVSAAVNNLSAGVENMGSGNAAQMEVLKGLMEAGVDISKAAPGLKLLVQQAMPEVASQAKELLLAIEKA